MPEPGRPAAIRENPPADDHALVDRDLAGFLRRSRRRFADDPHLRPIFVRAAEFVLRGGKRLRPLLCLASYRIVSGEAEIPKPARRASASLELFHAFMLVHDDLIDGSNRRRGRPSLHEAIRLDSDEPDCVEAPKRAADLALVAGDILYALGNRMLAGSGLPPSVLARAIRLVSEVLVETGAGEALDILYESCPLERLGEPALIGSYLRKTARYSVSGPMTLGAALARADGPTIRILRSYGDLLGLAYQLRNDLDALRADPEADEHPDLDGGKRTWVLWMAFHRLDAAGRRQLADALDDPVGIDRRRLMLRLIAESGAPEAARVEIRSLRERAERLLADSPLDRTRRLAFTRMAGLITGAPTPHPAAGLEDCRENSSMLQCVAEARE